MTGLKFHIRWDFDGRASFDGSADLLRLCQSSTDLLAMGRGKGLEMGRGKPFHDLPRKHNPFFRAQLVP